MIGLLVAALVLLISAPVWATTYYVGKSGSNSNSCATAQSSTASNRKLTIEGSTGGISCLASGDTLIIGAGVYDESIGQDSSVLNNTIPNGSGAGGEAAEATWSGATVIRAETPCSGTSCSTILRPSSSANCYSGVAVIWLTRFQQAQYIIFQGFEADANSVCTQVARFFTQEEILPPNHIRVQNVYFHDSLASSGGSGLIEIHTCHPSCASPSTVPTNMEVLDSVITRHSMAGSFPTAGGNHCLYWNAHGTIRRNTISYCSPTDGNGQAIGTHSGPGNYTVDISANDISFYGFQGIEAANVLNTNIYNNTVHDGSTLGCVFSGFPDIFTCSGITVQGAGGATNTLVANNTIYNVTSRNNGGINIESPGSTSNTTIQNNIVFGGDDDRITTNSAGGTFSNNRCDSGCATTADPMFFNAAASDFHLSSSSPTAITEGGVNLSSTFSTDKAGNNRGSTWTIGAYAVSGSSPPTTVSFSDQFNRANNSDLGADWTPESGRAMQIVSNRIRPSVVNFGQEEIVTVVSPAANQYASILISTFTSGGVYGDVRAFVRAAHPSTARRFYECDAYKNNPGTTSDIVYFDGSSYTTIASENATTWAAGDRMECRAEGTTISLYRTPSGSSTATLLISGTHSTLTTGLIGVGAQDGGAVSNIELDNFNGGDYPAVTTTPNFPVASDFPSVTVRDDFNRADSGTLGSGWTSLLSDVFSIVSNAAAAPSGGGGFARSLYSDTKMQTSHEVYATWTTLAASGSAATFLTFAGTDLTVNNQYRVMVNVTSGTNTMIDVRRIDSGGGSTTIQSAVDLGFEAVSGNSFGVRVSGTTISVYWKWTDDVWYRVAQFTDSNLSSLPSTGVYGGIAGGSPSVIDNYGAGPFVDQPVQSPPSLPLNPSRGRFGTTFPSVR